MDKSLEKHISLLKRYYPLDEKRKVFDVTLRYEKASDLFDDNLDSDLPKMKDEIFDKVIEILDVIPHGYKADISLVVDDFEKYDKQTVIDCFNDLLFLTRYKYTRANKTKWFKVAALIAAGAFFIFLSSLIDVNDFWGFMSDSEVGEPVIVMITQIIGWVFIWESVSQIFIQKSDILRAGYLMLSKITTIAFYHGDEKKALAKESTKDIAKEMINKDLDRRAGLLLLMFSGFAIVGVGFASFFTLLSNYNPGAQYAVLLLVGGIIGVIIKIAIGAFAIALYVGKEKFKYPVLVIAIFDFLTIILSIIGLVIGGFNSGSILVVILSIIVNIAYFVGIILYIVGDHRQKKMNK